MISMKTWRANTIVSIIIELPMMEIRGISMKVSSLLSLTSVGVDVLLHSLVRIGWRRASSRITMRRW